MTTISLSQCRIPNMWQRATVIPLPKPGMPPGESTSYRPVSLLSPVSRTIEKILLPILINTIPMPEHQHGIRKGHSTTTALCNTTEKIAYGINQKIPPARTVLVALDLKRFFHTVNHEVLHQMILKSKLPSFLRRWLYGYLTGREQRTQYEGQLSKSIKLKSGVPQGGVLSPFLFCWYMKDMPKPSEGVEIICYADDITVLAQDKEDKAE